MAEANLAVARERSQSGFVPAVNPEQARRLRINARINRLAGDAYYAEQDVLGAKVVEPWSSLSAQQQRPYVKRQQAAIAAGIGHRYTTARRLSARHVSNEHGTFETYKEVVALKIEAMCEQAIERCEDELVAQFKEQSR